MESFLDHPYFRQLLALGLPGEHYAVAGSGALYARGLVTTIGDLDVIARGPAWEQAAARGPVLPMPSGLGVCVHLGSVDVFAQWFPPVWPSVDPLIDEAEVVRGIRVVTLEVVLRTKEIMARPKDEPHLRLLRDLLARGAGLGARGTRRPCPPPG